MKNFEYKDRLIKDAEVMGVLEEEDAEHWEAFSTVFARVYDAAKETSKEAVPGLRIFFKRPVIKLTNHI